MISFALHGRYDHGVDAARRVLGRACFIAGFEVQDFIVRSRGNDAAYVKIGKEPILSRDLPGNPDFVLVFGTTLNTKEIFRNVADSAAIFNAEEKPKLDLLKRNKIKVFCVDAFGIGKRFLGRYTPDMAMLGALAKKFAKLSMKSIKSSMQYELADAETGVACLEEGYRKVS